MHDTNRKSVRHRPGVLVVALLGICLLLPASALAYGGGKGSRGETDKPENNRVFDDETPNVPASRPVRPHNFPVKPLVIKPHSAWVRHGQTMIDVMRVIDMGGIPAGVILFVFAGPEYVTYHTIKWGIMGTRIATFGIDKVKQDKAWGVLKWAERNLPRGPYKPPPPPPTEYNYGVPLQR